MGTQVSQSMDAGHNESTVRAAVDFYYDLGALINIYSHLASTGGVAAEYVRWSASKPRVWQTNAVGVYDWWRVRSNVVVAPSYSEGDGYGIARATVSGAIDPDSAVEIVIPERSTSATSSFEVFTNGQPVDPSLFRATKYGVKIDVGNTMQNVEVHYTLPTNRPAQVWLPLVVR